MSSTTTYTAVNDMDGPLCSVEQLASIADDTDVVLVDCRFSLSEPDEGRRLYDQGHIGKAVYADLNRDLSAPVQPGVSGRHPLPEPEVFARQLGAWGISTEHRVVAYDDSGGAFAARLWWMLRWLGHDACAVLDGGLRAWTDAGNPLCTEHVNPQHATFVMHPRSDVLATARDVTAAIANPDWRLLDARAPSRFRGDEEPIDSVAGHIPSAVCLPFVENLDDGGFRSRAELRQRFEQALDGVACEHTIVYCGSGVTACHDILAATHAGLDGMKLYAGSWSEWIVDPNRPIETGD